MGIGKSLVPCIKKEVDARTGADGNFPFKREENEIMGDRRMGLESGCETGRIGIGMGGVA